MGDTVFAKGAATGDEYKAAVYVRRRFGGLEIGVVNTGEADDLDYVVEGAAGPDDTIEVPDWSAADAVATGAAVSGDAAVVVDLPVGSALHKNYRVSVRSAATGASTSYVIWAEDEKA